MAKYIVVEITEKASGKSTRSHKGMLSQQTEELRQPTYPVWSYDVKKKGCYKRVKNDSSDNLPNLALNEVARMNSKIMETSTKFRVAVSDDGLNDILCELIETDLAEAKIVITRYGDILGDYWSIERLKEEVSELEQEYNYLNERFRKVNRFFYKNDYDQQLLNCR